MVKMIKTESPAAAGVTDTPGKVESLEALAAEAAGMQASEQAQQQQAHQAGEQAQQQQAHQDMAAAVREVADVLRVGRDMLAEFADEAGILPREKTLTIWSNDTLDKLAGPLLVVADRHGGQLGEFMQKHGPYIALGFAALMPTVATIKAVRHHKALPVPSREVKPAGEGGLSG